MINPGRLENNKIEEESYAHDYNILLSSSINPSNVLTFHDDALKKLISVVDGVVEKYKQKHPETSFTRKELEDEALREENLQDVSTTLSILANRKADIDSLKNFVSESISLSENVFVPPTNDNGRVVNAGSGVGMEEKRLVPRLLTLLYILENDLNIVIKDAGEDRDVNIEQGAVTDNMMREQPYFRVLIDSLNRVVYICEEEGNASFVFDKDELEKNGFDIDKLDTQDKSIFNRLIAENKKLGKRVIHSPSWRADMLESLSKGFLQEEKIIKQIKQNSDFSEKIVVPDRKEGWRSAKSLLEEVGMARETIITYADLFRKDHPEWFEVQRNKARVVEHYHPELVSKIIEYSHKVKRKDGWKSANGLNQDVDVRHRLVKKYVEGFRKDHPEWFDTLQKGRGRPTEYYHPDLIAEIKKEFNMPRVKEGWKSASSLFGEVNASMDSVKKYAESFKKDHPEWFEVQKTRSFRIEHYSPNLAAKIIEHFRSIPPKKEGWESSSSLRTKLAIPASAKTIEKYAESFKKDHPEWFEAQKNYAALAEYYHPDLTAKIIENFGKKD